MERRAAQLDVAGARSRVVECACLKAGRSGELLNGKEVGAKNLSEQDALKAEFAGPCTQIMDEQGQPLQDAVVPLAFTVSRAGEIAALGNAKPKDVASFREPRRNTYHGACVVIVRPAGKPGTIDIRAAKERKRQDCERRAPS